MKKLNKDIKVGDRFIQDMVINTNFPRGEYEITETDCQRRAFYFTKVKHLPTGKEIFLLTKNVQYFCGEEVDPHYRVAYDWEDYQPTPEETQEYDFVTEDKNEEFGDWYLTGDFKGNLYFENGMLKSRFAWVDMPWYK